MRNLLAYVGNWRTHSGVNGWRRPYTNHTIVGRTTTAAAKERRAQRVVLTITGVWRVRPRRSVLPLLPWLHIVFQGGEAAAVPVHSGHRAVLVAPWVVFPPGGPLLVVSLIVEVCEENDEGNHVSNLEIQPPQWERARPDDPAGGLDDCQHKLDQLPLSDVLLPPEVWTHGRDRRQAVVRVHEDVDEAVKRGTEIRVATRNPVHHKPPDIEHGGVVVDVQDCDLVAVLT